MSKRVLIVDDEPDVLETLAELVSAGGYDVITRGSFEEARKAITDDPPDILVTDVRLGPFNADHRAVGLRRSDAAGRSGALSGQLPDEAGIAERAAGLARRHGTRAGDGSGEQTRTLIGRFNTSRPRGGGGCKMTGMAGWRPLGLAVIALFAGAVTAASAAAQSKPEDAAGIPRNPTALSFGVSPDHEAPADSGRQILKYIIDFVPVEGMGKAREVDLGKPPAPDGIITVSLAPIKLSPGRYLASVRAISSRGSSVSETVGPFQIGNPKRSAPRVDTAPPPASAPEEEERPRGKRGFWKRMYDAIVG
jgi:hypothetical protein